MPMEIARLISLFKLFSAIDWLKLKPIISHFLQWHSSKSAYQVLNNRIQLEILDEKGKVASFQKRKSVRFLQNETFAFLDTVWGDGDICVEYQCSPGKAVDFYEEGYRQRVLIALHEMKQRGNTETFYIERKIYDGYREPDGYLQTDITYPTRHLEIVIIFPKQRYPSSMLLMEKNTKKTVHLPYANFQHLPDGRRQVTWQKKYPKLHESYILSWHW